jgi:hypothetical protein
MALSAEVSRFFDTPWDKPLLVRVVAGGVAGALFTIFVPAFLLMWALDGPEVVYRRQLLRVDLAALLYPIGAVLSGSLFAALVVQARSKIAAMAAAFAAFLPWMAAMALCTNRGYEAWAMGHTVTTIFGALLLGFPLGLAVHGARRKRDALFDRAA